MAVPYMDLRWQMEDTKGEAQAAVLATLKKGDFILGQNVADFEQAFAQYCGVKHAVGVGSGLDALVLSLKALGVGPGDEVITCPTTFIATVFAITATGAVPVFVDCIPETGLLDPDLLSAAITPKTKVIIPVHLYGKVCDMNPILDIAQKHHLKVIEDAAQAHGARYQGRRAGSFGTTGCFSFYPAKNLGCAGDGGMLVTNDDAVMDQVKLVRNYGQEPKNIHPVLGVNSRLDTLHAGFLQAKLKRLDDWNAMRVQLARLYHEGLSPLGIQHFPVEEDHVYHVYAIEVQDRAKVQQKLTELGIDHGVHYPVPCHLQSALSSYGFKKGQCPRAEARADRLLSLPMFPGMTQAQVEEVVAGLKAAGAQS